MLERCPVAHHRDSDAFLLIPPGDPVVLDVVLPVEGREERLVRRGRAAGCKANLPVLELDSVLSLELGNLWRVGQSNHAVRPNCPRVQQKPVVKKYLGADCPCSRIL